MTSKTRSLLLLLLATGASISSNADAYDANACAAVTQRIAAAPDMASQCKLLPNLMPEVDRVCDSPEMAPTIAMLKRIDCSQYGANASQQGASSSPRSPPSSPGFGATPASAGSAPADQRRTPPAGEDPRQVRGGFHVDRFGARCIANRGNANHLAGEPPNRYKSYDISYSNQCSYSITLVLQLYSGAESYLDVPANSTASSSCTDGLSVNKDCHGFKGWREEQ